MPAVNPGELRLLAVRTAAGLNPEPRKHLEAERRMKNAESEDRSLLASAGTVGSPVHLVLSAIVHISRLAFGAWTWY
jgi:hypothetical protein